MLHLLIGKDWTANRDAVLRRIAADVNAEKMGRILLVPELISHETERRLCAAAGDTASRFAEVLSFTQLARRVCEDLGCAAEQCMDAGGRLVAMASSARHLASRLKAYACVESRPEFLTGLIDAVDEFKRCCITAEDLSAAARETEGSLAQKLEELSLILEVYDSLCGRGKRDPRDVETILLEQMESGDYAKRHVFYIDGFPDFTRQHLAILEYLIKVSPCVTVSMNCDRVESNLLAFEKAGDTTAKILSLARQANVEVEIEVIPEENLPLAKVRNALFQGPIPTAQGCLNVYAADSPYHECLAAAERVMELVRSGCRYRDIMIVCADMPGYKALLNQVFHRCSIPLYLSGTEDILEKSVIATVLSALDAALGGFEQRQTLHYFRSVLSPVDPDTCDLMENYAVIWGVRGKKWTEDWKNHPDGLGEIPTEASNARLDRLNAARLRAITPLQNLRQAFMDARNLADQVQAVYTLLQNLGLQQRLEELSRWMDDAGDNRSAQILNQLWDILIGALEQLHDVLGATVWDSDSFTRLLRLLLSQYDVGTIPPVLDAVQAGSVSSQRLHQQKHLIVLGAREGNLPGYSGTSGVLTDQERVTLRQLGVPLTGGNLEGIQAEFAEIYGVFCGASESVTVYSSGGQPSFVCRRLADMAGGERKVEPMLGAALADPVEAGAWLARFDACEAADSMHIREGYDLADRGRCYALGKVSREQIDGLYGKTLNLSASQIDRQAECRLSYFLKYGLRAKERKEAAVDPAEFGTYVHAVLENTGRAVRELGGFRAVTLEQTLEIAERYSSQYAQEHFAGIDSERMTYLFRRNTQELGMVVQDLWEELQESQFQPEDFEVNFGSNDGLPPISLPGTRIQAILRGFVDRVDTWRINGNDYFRVVDYKTGKKDFDYCDVFNGVGLQMLLYLFALQECGEPVVGDNPIPVGVQYFPARVPYVSSDGRLDDDALEKERDKARRRKGLLLRDEEILQAMEPGENPKRLSYTTKKDGTLSGDLADREQLKQLKSYIFKTLGNMVDEIASGDVSPNPYTRGTAHSACAFCPYGTVCHEAQVTGRRNYKTMTAQRFWEEIGKEMDRHG